MIDITTNILIQINLFYNFSHADVVHWEINGVRSACIASIQAQESINQVEEIGKKELAQREATVSASAKSQN